MSNAAFHMRDLIEAGVHFGHKTKRWNPKMAPYLYGVRNDIHIIDLGKTVPLLHQALEAVRTVMSQNGRLLFVGTKRQAADLVVDAAKRSGQYYINNRWLGGLLTNWQTIQNSIRHLRKLDEQLSGDNAGFTKKELLQMSRERVKLESSLGGIKDMGGLPNLIFVIDTTKEDLAIAEAARLGIPVVAVVDSNASLDGVTYPIPGNDDSIRAIKLYCDLIADAALAGISEALSRNPAREKETAPTAFEIGLAETKVASKPAPDAEAKNGRGKGRAPTKKAPVVTKKPSRKLSEDAGETPDA